MDINIFFILFLSYKKVPKTKKNFLKTNLVLLELLIHLPLLSILSTV